MRERNGFDLWGTVSESRATASVIAIIVGLLVGFLVILFSNPAHAVEGFGALLLSGVRSMNNLGQALYNATPLIMTGLAVGFAGKTGLFNIGASGQFIVGAYLAILVGVRATFLPGPLLLIAALLAGIIGGAVWGAVPGALKAWRNVNEVIACIMMNYIAVFAVNYMVLNTVYDQRRNSSMQVAQNANLPRMGLDQIFSTGGRPSSVNAGIVLAILVAILMYIILTKTTTGFELRACGFNKDAAQYAGINSKRGILMAMVISGALAGLGGAILYLGGVGKTIDVVDVLAPEGFNGIPVALLALNNPIGIIFTAIFIGYLTVGGLNMQPLGYAPQIVDMIIAIIIYFSALSLLVMGFFDRINRRRVAAAEAAQAAAVTDVCDKGGGVG